MSTRYAVLMAVESAADLPPAPFAADEVTAFAERLESFGFTKPHVTVLAGPTATRSAAESRLRKASRSLQAGDEAWFVFAGPAFSEDGRGFLACADTLDDDRAATALALADIVRLLQVEGVAVRFFLDATDLSDDELADLFPDDGQAVALTANVDGQPSQAAAGRRLWLQLVGDALAGQAPAAIRGGQVTVESLHDWTTKELPRAVRKVISDPKKQTPGLFGSASAVIGAVEAAAPTATARLDLKQLKRIVFRGESHDKVRHLTGYQKGYKLPEAATPSAQKWTYRMAAEDLRQAVEEIYNGIREHLGYKRKDLESSIGGDGVGFIRTPGFDYMLSVSLDSADPTSIVWRNEVSQVADPAILRSAGFRAVFGHRLDTLEFSFTKPIDVGDLVDCIEEDLPPGTKVRVASDNSSCDVTVQGFAGRIHVERATLRIEGTPGLSPESLVEQFFAFQTRYGGRKGPLAIGLKGNS